MRSDNDKRLSNCGLLGWRPEYLQALNKPAVFLILFSLSSFCTTITVGMNQVLMPALQQLFNMTSKQMGYILVSNDLSGFVVAFIFGHFSSKGKVRWIFVGILISLAACLMQSGTQLLVKLPERSTENGTSGSDSMCVTGESTQNSDYSLGGMFYAVQNNKLFWVLFVAGMLQGVGNTPLLVCGMTYLDEILTQKKLGPALAFSNIVNYMAFPISFVLGSILIQQYVTLGDPPPGVNPQSNHWVGAWWLGYLIPGILLVITGFPLLFFPTQMPAAKSVLKKKIMRGESTEEEKEAELTRSHKELIKDIVPTIKRLMQNKALVFLLCGEAMSNIFLSSMPFDTKLYSLLFKIPVPKTGTLLGILRTIATIVGLAIGGTIVGKRSLTGKQCIKFLLIVQALTLPLTLFTLWHCTPDVIVGLDYSYQGLSHQPKGNLSNTCNENCLCSTQFYEPTCDLEERITYFTPCHAGCTSSYKNVTNNKKIYTNCKCSKNDLLAEACPPEPTCEKKMWIVLIAQNLIGIIVFISGFPAMHIAYLRIVNEIDRSATQGAKQFFTRAFGFLLGPIIFGAIIDNYCVVWRGEGDNSGSCLIYDLEKLIVTFAVCQAVFRLLCVILFFMSWRSYPETSQYKLQESGNDSDLDI